jgi:hypothetical protein
MKCYFLIIFSLVSIIGKSQKFKLSETSPINSSQFELIDISNKTGVKNYKYIGIIKENLFGRKVESIDIGIKYDIIVSTLYRLIPTETDVNMPSEIVKQVETDWGYKLGYSNGTYGLNIDDKTYLLSRMKNKITFDKDRIVLYSTIKRELLLN